jgi:hypothetical protein
MTMALILPASLWLATMVLLVFGPHLRSRLLKTPSPTPTSLPPMPKEEPMVQMMQMMTRMMETSQRENRELLEMVMFGKEMPPSTNSTISSPEQPSTYDPESTPLSPGIEAVISREMEEDQEDRSRTERAALQQRLAELQAEELSRMAQNGSEDSLPGPWSRTPEESDTQT